MDISTDGRPQVYGASRPSDLSKKAASDVGVEEQGIDEQRADVQDVDVAAEILEALEDIEVSGTFAYYNSLPTTSFVRPDIRVNGVGAVELPLSEEHARQLIARSRQAPFGKGNETIVDTSVRNTWELDPTLFEIRNLPTWKKYVARMVCLPFMKELGIQASRMRAELYKMLIYEKGAMFKAHTDTEKIPGMFGTLVICLPSPHEGGEIVVQHGGQKKIFKTSAAEQSYACWYSDVLHEVLPVTSGYRWVLTYNLVLDLNVPRPTAALQGSGPDKLRRALQRWLSPDHTEPLNHFYYGLDHEYTEANISLASLKLADFARGKCLQQMSSELNVDVFLAILEKEEKGSCEANWDHYGGRRRRWDEFSDDDDEESTFHALEDIYETDFYVKKLVSLDGRHVLGGMALSDENLLQDDFFSGVTPEETQYQGYMGNYGPDATHMYRVTAAVIVQRESTLDFLLASTTQASFDPDKDGDVNLLSLIGHYADLSLLPSSRPSAWNILRNLCDRAWSGVQMNTRKSYKLHSSTADVSFGGEIAAKVLTAAITLEEWPFFDLAVSKLKHKLPLSFFSWMGGHMTANGLPMGRVQKGLFDAVLSYSSLCERFKAISNFAPATTELSEERGQWARTAIAKSLASSTSLTLGEEDGRAVLDTVQSYHSFSYLSESVAPLVLTRIKDVSFALAFLSTLLKFGTGGVLPTEEAVGLYKDVAKPFVNVLDFANIRSAERLASLAKSSRQSYSTSSRRPSEDDLKSAVRHQALMRFVTSILDLGMEGEELMESFQSRLVLDAERFPAAEFHPFWLPFLRSLVEILGAESIPLSTPRYQQVFTTILSSYLNNYVGEEPREDVSLARRGVSCSCGDCTWLSAFLVDPQRKVGHFAVNKSRRAHLHSQLNGHDCSHETERYGSPQTLVVTKTFVHSQRARAAWKARKTEALKKLAEFDQHKLSMLLGPEYLVITGMKHLSARSGPAAATSGRSAKMSEALAQIPTNKHTTQSLSSLDPSPRSFAMKRKASEIELVDLTEDE